MDWNNQLRKSLLLCLLKCPSALEVKPVQYYLCKCEQQANGDINQQLFFFDRKTVFLFVFEISTKI